MAIEEGDYVTLRKTSDGKLMAIPLSPVSADDDYAILLKTSDGKQAAMKAKPVTSEDDLLILVRSSDNKICAMKFGEPATYIALAVKRASNEDNPDMIYYINTADETRSKVHFGDGPGADWDGITYPYKGHFHGGYNLTNTTIIDAGQGRARYYESCFDDGSGFRHYEWYSKTTRLAEDLIAHTPTFDASSFPNPNVALLLGVATTIVEDNESGWFSRDRYTGGNFVNEFRAASKGIHSTIEIEVWEGQLYAFRGTSNIIQFPFYNLSNMRRGFMFAFYNLPVDKMFNPPPGGLEGWAERGVLWGDSIFMADHKNIMAVFKPDLSKSKTLAASGVITRSPVNLDYKSHTVSISRQVRFTMRDSDPYTSLSHYMDDSQLFSPFHAIDEWGNKGSFDYKTYITIPPDTISDVVYANGTLEELYILRFRPSDDYYYLPDPAAGEVAWLESDLSTDTVGLVQSASTTGDLQIHTEIVHMVDDGRLFGMYTQAGDWKGTIFDPTSPSATDVAAITDIDVVESIDWDNTTKRMCVIYVDTNPTRKMAVYDPLKADWERFMTVDHINDNDDQLRFSVSASDDRVTNITGLDPTNVDSDFKWWVKIVSDGSGFFHVDMYKDSGFGGGDLVAHTATYDSAGFQSLVADNSSGISGSIEILDVVGADSDIEVNFNAFITFSNMGLPGGTTDQVALVYDPISGKLFYASGSTVTKLNLVDYSGIVIQDQLAGDAISFSKEWY